MKQLILSNNNNLTFENISSIPNYSMDNIGILYSYIANRDIFETIFELCKKITIHGTLTVEITNLKLAAKHYLAGNIAEKDFLILCKSIGSDAIDITELISLLKNKEDMVITNISQNNYINTLTIERQSLK